jgi:ATP-binding cassette subfamily B protein
VTRSSTSAVAWRLLKHDPTAFAYAWLQWVSFHLAPLPVGLVLKAVLDHVTHGRAGVPFLLLTVLLGLEVGRWALFVSAAMQWHGAWVGWQTAPRVTILRSLVGGGGPAAGRLPGSPGEAVSRFRDDVEDVALVLDVWLDISGAVLSASFALVVVAFIAPAAALAVGAPVGIALAFSWWLGPRLRAWRRAAREATAAVTGFIGDTFGAILAVKVATGEAAVEARFAALNAERARVSRTDQVATELVRSLGYGTGEIAIGVVLLIVAAAFRRGDVTVGDIGLFASYAPVIAGLPKWGGRLGAYLRQADVSVDRLAELLPPPRGRAAIAAPVRTHLRHGPPPLPAPVPPDETLDELRVEGLTARHGGAGRGIEDVDLLIRRGELVVVTGVVGAGKTTLLRALLGLVPVDAGVIRWNGAAVADPATFLVPPRVAFLPQVPRLFSEPLADTVLLGLPDDGLLDALRLTCLDEDLAEMPDGVATVIGPRGLRLSGGQVQRAGAARALVRRPELLVVDDLSSALDVATEARLWQRVAEGGFSTALLVSHRPTVLARADRVVVLSEGRVVDVRTRSQPVL